jgi:hypothetical protein
MTSENLAEHEAVESAAAVSVKAVDNRLIDELVRPAQFEGRRPANRPSPATLPRKRYSAGTKSPDNVQVEHGQHLEDFRPSSNTVARRADVAADLDRRP